MLIWKACVMHLEFTLIINIEKEHAPSKHRNFKG